MMNDEKPPSGYPEATLRPSGGQPVGTPKPPGGYPQATLRLPRSYPEALEPSPGGPSTCSGRLVIQVTGFVDLYRVK